MPRVCCQGIICPVNDEGEALASGDLDLPRTEDGYIASIIGRTPGGALGWEALPPDGERDAWVSVVVEGDVVVANSWSGWQVRLSLGNGYELSRRFTK